MLSWIGNPAKKAETLSLEKFTQWMIESECLRCKRLKCELLGE